MVNNRRNLIVDDHDAEPEMFDCEGLPRSSRTCFLFLLRILLSSQSYRRRRRKFYCQVSRGVIMLTGFGAGSYKSGERVAKYEETIKAIDNEAWDILAQQQALLTMDMSKS